MGTVQSARSRPRAKIPTESNRPRSARSDARRTANGVTAESRIRRATPPPGERPSCYASVRGTNSAARDHLGRIKIPPAGHFGRPKREAPVTWRRPRLRSWLRGRDLVESRPARVRARAAFRKRYLNGRQRGVGPSTGTSSVVALRSPALDCFRRRTLPATLRDSRLRATMPSRHPIPDRPTAYFDWSSMPRAPPQAWRPEIARARREDRSTFRVPSRATLHASRSFARSPACPACDRSEACHAVPTWARCTFT